MESTPAAAAATKIRLPRPPPPSFTVVTPVRVSRRHATLPPLAAAGHRRRGAMIQAHLPPPQAAATPDTKAHGENAIAVRAVVTVRRKEKESLLERAGDRLFDVVNGIGRGIIVQLVSEELDPATNAGRRSAETPVKGWLPQQPSAHPLLSDYAADLTVPSSFGRPGAVVLTNLHSKEFFLTEIAVHGFPDGPIFFRANSWIHSCRDSPESRVIFTNHAYLPSNTPAGLIRLRQEELLSNRGNGEGERKKFERIYDYDVYNDLGNPDKHADLARPVIGGPERPYPRRCRTGRPPTNSDPCTESRVEEPHPVYVPRDETFEELKESTFAAGRVKALLHNLVPGLAVALSGSDSPFQCFSDIDRLYKEGLLLKKEEAAFRKNNVLNSVVRSAVSISERLLKYDMPTIISRDRFSWLRDIELARQTLAGVNPVDIQRLREFPILSKLDPETYGPPESALTKEILEHELSGMSLQEAMENNRLYMIDYHDILLPFVEKINSLKERKMYASRAILLHTPGGILKPVAIELSLPPSSGKAAWKRVYTDGQDATAHWIWKLAKAHACCNDTGVHQLVNHWLRTHACMEPYIIAAHRQLSAMHPVFKLLHPHMRYTMEINALARQSLINGGGIIESCYTPEKYAIELSSAAYAQLWRFDMEALPADLLRRGMAVEDPSMPCGVKLVIEDYPYAADGLLLWSAIESWVQEYVSLYYADSSAVAGDGEVQKWWEEVISKGHPDKRGEPWWPAMQSKEELAAVLTTVIWTASGQHAAINFGQYPFGGYMPNRPTLMKKLIPQEGDDEYESLLFHPQSFFLSALPSQLQVTQIMAVQDTLSTHSPDEEYLGQAPPPASTDDRRVAELFEKFAARLKEVEEVIERRNKDHRLKNRCGAGVPPYELLLPSSEPGVTGRGVPNSVSI